MEKFEQSETKEKEPKISYHILYNPHATPKDLEKFPELFKEADIYIPETEGHDARMHNLLNMLSQGKCGPREVASRTWVREGSPQYKIYETIYNSKKPILFVDVPFDNELIKVSDRIDDLGRESLDLFRAGEFKPALKKIHKYIMDEADHELKREAIMKKNLKEKIGRFVKEYPELKSRDEIKALLTLGAAHTRLYQDLKKENIPISREFSRQPFVFNHLLEALRRIMFAKNKKPDKTMLARGIVDTFLGSYYLGSITKDTSKVLAVSYKISSKLGLKDIKKISERMGENPEENIANSLEPFGIKIPETEEEIDEMLGTKK